MVSRVTERHSELKQNLISILQDIYPEISSSFLDNLANELVNLARKKRSADKSRDRSLWSANDVLLIAYPDNIISHNISPLQSLQKFLTKYFSRHDKHCSCFAFFPFYW